MIFVFQYKASLYAIIVPWKNVAYIEIAQINVSVTFWGVILLKIALKRGQYYVISGSKIVAQIEVSVTYCSATLKKLVLNERYFWHFDTLNECYFWHFDSLVRYFEE